MLTFDSGFRPGSKWFCQVQTHPRPRTRLLVWFGKVQVWTKVQNQTTATLVQMGEVEKEK